MKLSDTQPKCDLPFTNMERLPIILMVLIALTLGEEKNCILCKIQKKFKKNSLTDVDGMSISDKYDSDNLFQYIIDDVLPKQSPTEIIRDIFSRNRDKLPSPQSRHKGSSIVIEIPDYSEYLSSALGSLICEL